MKYEIELLANLNNQSKNIKSFITQATLALNNWLIDVEKKASNLKGMRAQKQNHLILMLSGLVAFLVVAWMGLAYLFRWQRNKIGNQVEAEVKVLSRKESLETSVSWWIITLMIPGK